MGDLDDRDVTIQQLTAANSVLEDKIAVPIVQHNALFDKQQAELQVVCVC
jgi:hypothetical protein